RGSMATTSVASCNDGKDGSRPVTGKRYCKSRPSPSFRVAGRAWQDGWGAASRRRRPRPLGCSQTPAAKCFCCEQEPPGFEGAGSSAISARGRRYARTEKMAFAVPPSAVEIPSDGSEEDAQPHTGGSTRQGD